MRDLIITENITLDGVIDAAEGWFAPAGDEDVDQSDIIAALAEQREAADAFLVGRTTFEEMRGYWPHQTDDTTGVTDYLNRVSNTSCPRRSGIPSGAARPCCAARCARTSKRSSPLPAPTS